VLALGQEASANDSAVRSPLIAALAIAGGLLVFMCAYLTSRRLRRHAQRPSARSAPATGDEASKGAWRWPRWIASRRQTRTSSRTANGEAYEPAAAASACTSCASHSALSTPRPVHRNVYHDPDGNLVHDGSSDDDEPTNDEPSYRSAAVRGMSRPPPDSTADDARCSPPGAAAPTAIAAGSAAPTTNPASPHVPGLHEPIATSAVARATAALIEPTGGTPRSLLAGGENTFLHRGLARSSAQLRTAGSLRMQQSHVYAQAALSSTPPAFEDGLSGLREVAAADERAGCKAPRQSTTGGTDRKAAQTELTPSAAFSNDRAFNAMQKEAHAHMHRTAPVLTNGKRILRSSPSAPVAVGAIDGLSRPGRARLGLAGDDLNPVSPRPELEAEEAPPRATAEYIPRRRSSRGRVTPFPVCGPETVG
jgi:hypothetical protein